MTALFKVSIPHDEAKYGSDAGATLYFHEGWWLKDRLSGTVEWIPHSPNTGYGQSSWWYDSQNGLIDTSNEWLLVAGPLIQEAFQAYLVSVVLEDSQ